MLGTNDIKDKFSLGVEEIVFGFTACIESIKSTYKGMSVPKVILVIPPVINFKNIPVDWGFSHESELKSKSLVERMKEFAAKNNILVFDSNEYVSASEGDGVHLNEESYKKLGQVLSNYIQSVL